MFRFSVMMVVVMVSFSVVGKYLVMRVDILWFWCRLMLNLFCIVWMVKCVNWIGKGWFRLRFL